MAARRQPRIRARFSVTLAAALALGPCTATIPASVGPAAASTQRTTTASTQRPGHAGPQRPANAGTERTATASTQRTAREAPDDEGAFTLPLSSTKLQVWQGQTATFSLDALLSPSAREDLDMSSAQLSIAPSSQGTKSSPAKLSADKKTVTIPNRGTWAIEDGAVTYTPEAGKGPAPQSVNLQIRNKEGKLSQPATLVAIYPYAANQTVHAAEGVSTTVDLDLDPELLDTRSVALTLQNMPTGTALADGGKSMVVPGEGTWTVNSSNGNLKFVPLQDRLGEQPSPVHYTATDKHGRTVGPSLATLKVPVIADVVRSSPYGEGVTFDLGSYAENIDLKTLELVPYSRETDAQISHNGATVNVANQGVWRLDRESGKLYFTPLSATVTDVTPMGVRGRDAKGNLSSVAPVRVGYPQVSSRYRSFTWGSTATFTPLVGSVNVQHQSFKFVGADMPAGTAVTTDGKTMSVPGEGVWSIEPATLDISFVPTKGLKKNPTPATFSVTGLYAGNETRGVLNAQYADAVPAARDDEATTSDPSTPLVIDVLANDTPASASQSLEASTLQLRSALAINIPDLVAGTGTRLVIPDQGTFQVTDAGAVEFVPASGFRGHTKPIDYVVQDSRGFRTTARLVVEVDQRAAGATNSSQDSGVNALLGRLMPSDESTFSMFASITALLCFTGVVSLWVGRRMERGSE